ncbi:o-succinylbenzoate--CoA ligase [Vibrio sp. FNV 38]|nr:o-succinylbenzoate--CoA ligase [Vibrio sp. FNV 38]
MTLPWQDIVQQRPDQIALITEDRQWTWHELSECTSVVAQSFKQQGVKPNQVVSLLGKNSLEALIVYLANLQIGAITAWIMPEPWSRISLKLEQLYTCTQRSHFFISDLEWASLDNTLLEQFTQRHDRLVCPALGVANRSTKKVFEAPSEFSVEQLASIVFTSGSMGRPKAVAHRYQQHLTSALGLLQKFEFKNSDTWLLSLPLYHVSGLAIVHRWLAAGATLKLGSGILAADIKSVTHVSLVPTQLKRLLDTQSPLLLKRVLLGGAHIPSELAQQAQQRGIDTWLGYGMTEMASTVTAKQVDGQRGVGYLLPHRQLKLEDGRIKVSGKTLAAGYYQQGQLQNLLDDGWFDTKDLAHYENSELVIDGRADNCFISGGENVHCEEIEQVANQHPSVIQSIVIAVEDREFGARPLLLVETITPLDCDSIQALLMKNIAKFKIPKQIEILPKSLLKGGIKLSRYHVKQWVRTTFTDLNVM